MLILARKAGESIRIGRDVKLTVLRVRKNEVRLGLEAPREISIRSRDEQTAEPASDSGTAPDDA